MFSIKFAVYFQNTSSQENLWMAASEALTWGFCTADTSPVDTGRKLNVHKTLPRRSARLLNVLCMFNLRSVSTGIKF